METSLVELSCLEFRFLPVLEQLFLKVVLGTIFELTLLGTGAVVGKKEFQYFLYGCLPSSFKKIYKIFWC